MTLGKALAPATATTVTGGQDERPGQGLASSQSTNTQNLQYPPWSTVDRIERDKQLRTLSALALVFLGTRHPLVDELRAAETDAEAFLRAFDLMEALPAGTRRKMLGTFSRATWPPRPKRRYRYSDELDEAEPVGKFCDLT